MTNHTLTETLEPATRTPPVNMRVLAKCLKIETFGDPQLEALATACGQWFRDYQQGLPPRWISLLGKSGTGKTHCARALYNWAAQKRDPRHWNGEKFIDWNWFVITQLRTFHYEVFEELGSVSLLVLDDIGGEYDASGFVTSHLASLLNKRGRLSVGMISFVVRLSRIWGFTQTLTIQRIHGKERG